MASSKGDICAMDFQILLNNLTNPSLLFFVLGILAVKLKSDLEIPATSAKFIALYLMISIGFEGGQELSHSAFNDTIIWSLGFGVFLSASIPFYTFFLLKRKLGVPNAAAIAAASGAPATTATCRIASSSGVPRCISVWTAIASASLAACCALSALAVRLRFAIIGLHACCSALSVWVRCCE